MQYYEGVHFVGPAIHFVGLAIYVGVAIHFVDLVGQLEVLDFVVVCLVLLKQDFEGVHVLQLALGQAVFDGQLEGVIVGQGYYSHYSEGVCVPPGELQLGVAGGVVEHQVGLIADWPVGQLVGPVAVQHVGRHVECDCLGLVGPLDDYFDQLEGFVGPLEHFVVFVGPLEGYVGQLGDFVGPHDHIHITTIYTILLGLELYL